MQQWTAIPVLPFHLPTPSTHWPPYLRPSVAAGRDLLPPQAGDYLQLPLTSLCIRLSLQAEIFRHRKRGTIYSFADESEMITWLSVFNQAVASIIIVLNINRVGAP